MADVKQLLPAMGQISWKEEGQGLLPRLLRHVVVREADRDGAEEHYSKSKPDQPNVAVHVELDASGCRGQRRLCEKPLRRPT